MTKIQPGRPVLRLTDSYCSHLPLVIELHPKHLHLRIQGHRNGYDLGYEHLYWLAARQAADRQIHQRNFNRRLRRIA